MTKAGRSKTATTQIYVYVAGVVFSDEAEALERRLFGAPVESKRSRYWSEAGGPSGRQSRYPTFYPSRRISYDLTGSKTTSNALGYAKRLVI